MVDEPFLYGLSPCFGLSPWCRVLHRLDDRTLAFDNPIENGPTFLEGPRAASRRVDVVSGSATEISLNIEHRTSNVELRRRNSLSLLMLDVRRSMFDVGRSIAVVAWIVRGAVERDDAVLGEHLINQGVIEWAPVVAFDEERRSVEIKLTS